ncbi:MAG: hypothetical protein ABI190_11405 [Casimicrobiaceae bacterium]
MSAVRNLALAALCALLGACASIAPPQETFYFDENAMAPLPSSTVEYPPIEQVQMPAPVEPMPLPAPSVDAQPQAAEATLDASPPAGSGANPLPAPTSGAPVAQERIVVASIPPPPALPQIPSEDLEALVLMSDLARYNALSADDVKRELATVTQTFRTARNDGNRVRLAILFTMTHSPQDDLRAQQLLDNVAKSGGARSAVKELAAVLQAQVTERTRALREEQTRANDAVQKLEALRQMERSLLRDRVSSGGGGAGGGTGGGGK